LRSATCRKAESRTKTVSSVIRYGLLALGLLAAVAFLPRLVNRMRKAEATTWTEPDELHRQIESGRPLTVLDVRGADEFTGPLGHIPGAVNIPLGELDQRLDELRSTVNGDVAVVCRTDKRSAAAQTILRNAGFKNVAVLRGGMERWAALERETVRAVSDKGPMTA
jgi:rhodanese-related sulfurtransferase